MSVRELTIYAPEGLVAGGNIKGESSLYFNLVTGERVLLSDAEARKDTSWHIGVRRSFICVNGGVAGPGGVMGVCVGQPTDASREEFITMTDADWMKMFDAVTKFPDDLQLQPEGVDPAVFEWRVEKNGKWTAPVAKGWKLRLADGVSFAKMRVREIGEDGMTITIQYAFQPEKDAPLTEEKKAVIKPGEAFNFKTGEIVVPEGLNWDIKHAGEKIYLNCSASGPGVAGALGSNKYGAQWKTIENPSDCIAFFMDEYGSIFRSPKWYRYNIDGKHNIHPNGAVYGLRTADGDFKVQIFDYFEHKGHDLGNIRIRYAKL